MLLLNQHDIHECSAHGAWVCSQLLLPVVNLLNASIDANRGCYKSKDEDAVCLEGIKIMDLSILFALYQLSYFILFLPMASQTHVLTTTLMVHLIIEIKTSL